MAEGPRFWFECESCDRAYWKQDNPRNRRRRQCRLCALPKGREHPQYHEGGLVLDRDSGRWRIICRDGSRMYFYRAVLEVELGRSLAFDETVHHINGDTTDDRIENLQVISRSEHGRIHGLQWQAMRREREAA